MQLDIPDVALREALDLIVTRVHALGGRAVLVGGSVRDALFGCPAEDLDVEVFGVGPDALRGLLETHFAIDLVGRAFGVIKLRGLPVDVSLPRRESKRGLGHRGFEIESDPDLDLAAAARRRDFTINAIAWDPRTGEVIDPYGGTDDLRNRRLRHVSPQFVEDPLRVLRAMQFAARLDLDVASETIALCRSIDPEGLPPERQLDEWKKLLLLGKTISRGLAFWRDCGWVRHTPELEALIDCPQDPQFHPEGDVWIHTLHVLDAFAGERIGDPWEDLVVGFGCLCHDFGKPATTFRDGDRIRSPAHDSEGEGPTRSFLSRLTPQSRLIDAVVPLVREHMKPMQLFLAEAGAGAIRRLARRVGRIDRLVRVARADHRGRPPKPWDGHPAGAWLLDHAARLDLSDRAPDPIVKGRHLIERGLEPGPAFGPLLERCFEAQLDGRFGDLEGGLQHLDALLATEPSRSVAADP